MVVKKYFNHIKSKAPHHRRQHAAQVAGMLTALAFVVWVTTLGVRFANTGVVASDGSGTNANQTQLAGAGTDTSNGGGIEVVGTTTADDSSNSLFSDYSNQGSTQ